MYIVPSIYQKEGPNNTILTYFTPPPIIDSVIEYQSVNKDPNLRQLITEFYLKKTIKWINNYTEFQNFKKLLSTLNSNNGYNIIYNILKEYTKKYNSNWFDLKKNHYSQVKNYIHDKLQHF
jgi:hypothetical protein